MTKKYSKEFFLEKRNIHETSEWRSNVISLDFFKIDKRK